MKHFLKLICMYIYIKIYINYEFNSHFTLFSPQLVCSMFDFLKKKIKLLPFNSAFQEAKWGQNTCAFLLTLSFLMPFYDEEFSFFMCSSKISLPVHSSQRVCVWLAVQRLARIGPLLSNL